MSIECPVTIAAVMVSTGVTWLQSNSSPQFNYVQSNYSVLLSCTAIAVLAVASAAGFAQLQLAMRHHYRDTQTGKEPHMYERLLQMNLLSTLLSGGMVLYDAQNWVLKGPFHGFTVLAVLGALTASTAEVIAGLGVQRVTATQLLILLGGADGAITAVSCVLMPLFFDFSPVLMCDMNDGIGVSIIVVGLAIELVQQYQLQSLANPNKQRQNESELPM